MNENQRLLRLRRDFGLQHQKDDKRARAESGELSVEKARSLVEALKNQTAVGVISSGSPLHNFFGNGLPLEFHFLNLVIVGIGDVESSCRFDKRNA